MALLHKGLKVDLGLKVVSGVDPVGPLAPVGMGWEAHQV